MPAPFIYDPAAEQQNLDEILIWHRRIVAALLNHHASIQQAVVSGTIADQSFIGMTSGDVDALFDAQRRELDRLTVLNLVASAEASLKVDYHRRVRQRLKDS